MTKKVLIDIHPDGSVKVDAQGFTGQQCSLATRDYELLLAGDMSNVDDKKKPDFFQTTGSTQTHRNG